MRKTWAVPSCRIELTPWVLGKDMRSPVPLGTSAGEYPADGFFRRRRTAPGQMIAAVNQAQLDRLLFIGSLWTPPDWMKQGSHITAANNNSCGGHLKMDAQNLHAVRPLRLRLRQRF